MELITQLKHAHQQRPVFIIGAAFVDLVMNTPSLPTRGDDIFVHSSSVTVGGCALNIARIHKTLELDSVAAIPVGQGLWAGHIRNTLEKEGIQLTQERSSGDNGWCLAMVEADGERTFLSSEGVEADWTREDLDALKVPDHGIVYLSGYQLAAITGDLFLDWIESLPPTVDIVFDPGPRLVDLSERQWQRLYRRSVLLTLNRRETELLAKSQPAASFCRELAAATNQALVYRMDKEGAIVFEPKGQTPIAPFPTQIVDTIGAGDAHAAGLIYGLALGLTVSQATLIGNAVASHAVEQQGASLGLNRLELISKLQKISYKE